MKTIRILLAEDQTLMRQGLKTLLETEPDFRIAGEAEDGKAAVKLALQAKPDIILMDVQMPQMNGVEATTAICRSWPDARIIILTTFDRDDYVFQSVRAGAVAICLKHVPAATLVETIRRVHAGEVFIQPQRTNNILERFLDGVAESSRQPSFAELADAAVREGTPELNHARSISCEAGLAERSLYLPEEAL